MSETQKTKQNEAPRRDQVMPAYAYPVGQNNSTVTVKRDAQQKVSVVVNGVFSY
jgi:ribosomal protein L25 (general stress protein Ctc)